MALIGRIGVIILAFLIASAMAGVAIALALLGPDLLELSNDASLRSGVWALVLVTASFCAVVAIIPLFLLVVVAEAFRLRSILLYTIVGAAVLPFGYFWTGFAERVDPGAAQLPIGQETAIAVGAGVVLGFVYWLIAGRKAGAWRDRPA